MRLPRPDPADIQRLEAAAARNPAVYRFKVIALALWGDVTLTAAQVLPIILPAALVLFVLNAALVSGSLFLLNAVGVIAVLFLIWLTRPVHRFDGTEIGPAQAPAFFQTLDALREKLAVSFRMRVMVDDDFNASAAETRGLLGVLGRQRTLTLGVPLLCVLPREQMLAVIGHELGHFSRRHGRFGHWLYRARGGWMMYAADVADSDGVLERAAAAFAQRFVPYFSACSFVLARQCEYEADADAAHATSAEAAAQALSRVEVYSRLWAHGFRREINRWRLHETRAPEDFLERFMHAAAQWPGHDLEHWLKQARAEKPSWIDTHPRLQERVDALKKDVALGVMHTQCAGESLFGGHWAVIKRDFNQRWCKRMHPKWLFQHLRRKTVVQPLLEVNATEATSLPVEAQLLRAEALKLENPDKGQSAIIEITQRYPDNAEVALRAAYALSEWDSERALELFQRAAALDSSYRAACFAGLSGLHEARGDGKEADRYAARADNAHKHASRAYETLNTLMLKGDVEAHVPNAQDQALLTSAAQADTCVMELWWFARDVAVPLKLASGQATSVCYSMRIGLWVIDPEVLRQSGENEDHVGERYTSYLQTLLPSNMLICGKAVLNRPGICGGSKP